MTNTYIKISTQEYPRHKGDIKIDSVEQKDYAIVEWVDMPVFDRQTQRCYEGVPEEIEGVWYMTWIVRDATQEEIDFANKPIDERFPK
jgi:hypothetical protein